VPQETIEADFVASNIYLAPRNKEMFKDMATATGMDVEALKKAMALRPELIRAMFSAIQNKYGSVETFFETRLGVGKEQIKLLRNKYTI
jgi:protein-tyrosine phosphatase